MTIDNIFFGDAADCKRTFALLSIQNQFDNQASNGIPSTTAPSEGLLDHNYKENTVKVGRVNAPGHYYHSRLSSYLQVDLFESWNGTF